MRLGHIQDLFRRTGFDEFVQHLARQVARVADLAPQLAVAEGTGTAFAELHIAVGVEHTLAPQAPSVLGALAHGTTAFQHDGRQAHLRQHQGREQPAGTEADDDGAMLLGSRKTGLRLRHEVIARVGAGPDMRVAGEALQHSRLVKTFGQLAIQRVVQHDGALLARIEAALENTEILQRLRRQVQARKNRRAQCGVGVVQRQPEVGDSKHQSRGSDRHLQSRACRAGHHKHRAPQPSTAAAAGALAGVLLAARVRTAFQAAALAAPIDT